MRPPRVTEHGLPLSVTHRKNRQRCRFSHCSRLLSRMLLLRSVVGLFRLCQWRRPSARVAGLLGAIPFPTADKGSIPAVRAMWRQRPLWPTTRRRAPRSECPLEGKHRTLIVVAHAGTHRRQFLPPNLCGFTPPLAPFPGAGEARPLEIASNRAVRPYAPRCPVVEFDPVRTHFAPRRP